MTTQQVDEGNTIHHEIKTRKQIIHIQCKFKNPRTSKNCPYAIICSFWSCVSFNLSHGSAWAKRTKELPDKVRCGSRRCCVIPPSKRPPPPSKALLVPFRIRVWPASETTLVSSDRSVSSSETCVVGHSIRTRILLGHAFHHHPVLFDTFLGSPQAASLTSVTVSAWKASKSSWPGQSQLQQQYGRFGEAWVLKVLK